MLNEKYVYADQLKSERLKTRFLNTGDTVRWSEFFENSEAVTFIQDFEPEKSMEHAHIWIERQLLRYKNQKFGLQALFTTNTNEFVGLCGLITQEIDDTEELEIGYHLLRNHWGKGYASEAARLFKTYATKNNLNHSVVSIIHLHNIRSQKVALNNGMAREKQSRWRDKDVFVYRVQI